MFSAGVFVINFSHSRSANYSEIFGTVRTKNLFINFALPDDEQKINKKKLANNTNDVVTNFFTANWQKQKIIN